MATRHPGRPISPHLTIWRWGPHMLVSILHRATGSGMATVGTLLLVWWLAALASGPEAYASFYDLFFVRWGGVLGYIVGIGLTLSFFQHAMSGVRHLFLDAGAGYEIKRNKTHALMTMMGSVTLTTLFWFFVVGVK
ncbi:MAG TPA: succinate dehydrogenase, cytochrome b556 subunit [Sphingomonas sp.]